MFEVLRDRCETILVIGIACALLGVRFSTLRAGDDPGVLPGDKVTANWVLKVNGEPVKKDWAGALGAEIKVSGVFNVLVKDGYQPGSPVLEVVQPLPSGELVTVQAAGCTRPKDDGKGNYSFDSKIKLPDKAGKYTLRIFFQRTAVCAHPIEVR